MSQRSPTQVEINTYAENYCLYGDQTKAFTAAFPNSTMSQKTKHEKASRMHGLGKLRARIIEIKVIMKDIHDNELRDDYIDTYPLLKKILMDAIKNGQLGAAVAACIQLTKLNGGYPEKSRDGGSTNQPIYLIRDKQDEDC